MNKKNVLKRLSCVFLASVVTLTATTGSVLAYTSTQLKTSVPASSVTTGNRVCGDYYKIETAGSLIKVTYKHKLAYPKGFSPRLLAYPSGVLKGPIQYKKQLDGLGAGETTSFEYDCSEVADGKYYFRVCANEITAESSVGLTIYPTLLPQIRVVVKDGIPTLYQFKNIAADNRKQAGKYSYTKSRKKSLIDYKYQLFNKRGYIKNPRTINEAAESTYYKKVSDKIVTAAKAYTNYKKAFAIFEFVTKNFYYDYYADANNKVPYDDPYYNLKNQQNKTGINANTYKGKVAVQCDGYAGLFTALARAQGIPTRMVYGRKITNSSTWEGTSSTALKTNTHTWVQCRINGRWVNIDPQQGSLNRYGNKDVKSNKKWVKSTIVNYYYFDMSYEQMAATHKFNKIVVNS